MCEICVREIADVLKLVPFKPPLAPISRAKSPSRPRATTTPDTVGWNFDETCVSVWMFVATLPDLEPAEMVLKTDTSCVDVKSWVLVLVTFTTRHPKHRERLLIIASHVAVLAVMLIVVLVVLLVGSLAVLLVVLLLVMPIPFATKSPIPKVELLD